MKTIARLILALAMVAATTSVALADEAHVVDIDHANGPQIVERSGLQDGTIRTAIVGHFLQVQFGHKDDPDSLADDIVSVDVSDPTIVRAVIALDGTVTLVREEAPEAPAPAPEPETIDLDETYPNVIDWSRLDALGLEVV